MKILVILILFLSGIHSFGAEGIPQHKVNQAYEDFKRKPINQEDLKQVEHLSSSEIYKQLLRADHSPSAWKEMRVMVIKKRPNDLAGEIRKTLEEFPLTIDTMGKLTFLASLVSPEFEAEIANGILGHPSAREFDIYFTESKDFRYHFRSEPDLLKSALDKLLSEGRIEKNSATHKKWEASISKFERIQDQRGKRKPAIQTTGGEVGRAEGADGDNHLLVVILASLAGLSVVVASVILGLRWKNSRCRSENAS